ncbi:MAG: YraN family protein [Patescibacteria group bacterium]|nr:YraN family protein [Patescibacteria group bacterium]
MTQKSQLGQEGEDRACEYLKELGYKIIERNYKKPWGELDIIAKDPDKTLVFVEVKTVRQNSSQNELNPEEQMNKLKMVKTSRMALSYANHNPDLINEKTGWRVDLIAIILKDCKFKISHYKNI